MNIRHLVGQEVTLVHISTSGVQTLFDGKLEFHEGKNRFVIWSEGPFIGLIRSLFSKRLSCSIWFPWTAVSYFEGRTIYLVDKETDDEKA